MCEFKSRRSHHIHCLRSTAEGKLPEIGPLEKNSYEQYRPKGKPSDYFYLTNTNLVRFVKIQKISSPTAIIIYENS